MAAQVLKLAVGVLTDCEGRMLVVRKKGTCAFMQPGGKIDADETPRQALQRELQEELSIDLELDTFKWLQQAQAPAANEPDTHVVADVFKVEGGQWPQFKLNAEIEEAHWLGPHEMVPLAPLTKDKIIPLLEWT